MSDEQKKVHVSSSGREAAVQVDASSREVAEALTGMDQVPEPGMELGRPPGKPPFDPMGDVEVEEAPEGVASIFTMVFVGRDTAAFRDQVQRIIAYCEGKADLVNISASIGPIDESMYEAIIEHG